MGGLIGPPLAADELKGRITHLVLKRYRPGHAPVRPPTASPTYVGHPPTWKTMAELEAWYRTNYAPFGPNTDAFWRRPGPRIRCDEPMPE